MALLKYRKLMHNTIIVGKNGFLKTKQINNPAVISFQINIIKMHLIIDYA